MKYIYILAIAFIFTCQANAQSVNEVWAGRYNGTANNYDEATSVVVDAGGNVFLCGASAGTGSETDIVTIKYSPAGAVLWTQRYNGTGNGDDDGYKLVLDDQSNAYVIGTSTGTNTGLDGILLKYSSTGTFLWGARYAGINIGTDEFYSVAVDAAQNVYVTGYSEGDVTGDDYITIKYNTAGVMQWAQRYNGVLDNDDYGNNIVLDNLGNVYVTGAETGDVADQDYCTIKYSNAGVQLWKATYNGTGDGLDFPSSSAIDLNTGSLYVIGHSVGVGSGADYCLVKYNLDGVEQWNRRYNGPGNNVDEAYSVIVDVSGSVYITGNSRGTTTMDDYCTIKYSSAGVQQWVARYDGTGSDDYANYFAVDPQGNVYVTGSSWGGAAKEDYVTIKYNFDGNQVWLKRMNGPGNDYDNANALTIDNAGNVYVTGGSESQQLTTDFLTIKYDQVTGIQTISGNVPDRFTLSQNYPNPFNPSTKIKFALPSSSLVKLTVYDVAGKEMQVLVNQNMNAGEYVYEWDGEKLNSGVYFYELEANDFSEVKRMVLVK